jgi:hypothetical protein
MRLPPVMDTLYSTFYGGASAQSNPEGIFTFSVEARQVDLEPGARP